MIAQRRLHRGSLMLGEIGFGAASLGNLYQPVADDVARDTLTTALDLGMNYVDTAPHYGHGLSERRVGDVVRERDGIVLSTKVGRLLKPDRALRGDGERSGFRSPLPFERRLDYSYDGILRSWEDSLQRLGLAAVDILYVHDIGRRTHGEDHDRRFAQLTRGGGFRALERLRADGEIAAFGLGVNEWEVCVDAMHHVDLDVVLLAGRYTLLEQDAADVFLPACIRRHISVVVGGPYNSGILATGTRGGRPVHYDYGLAPKEVVDRVRRIEALCDEFDVPLAAAALQFPLAHPAVVSVIPGLGHADRVRQTLDLYRHDIPTAFWCALRSASLVPDAVPLPGAAR